MMWDVVIFIVVDDKNCDDEYDINSYQKEVRYVSSLINAMNEM